MRAETRPSEGTVRWIGPVRLASCLMVISIGLAACGVMPSAYRLELEGSSWSVDSIDGQPTARSARPTVTFDTGAVIDTGCRSVRASWDMDSDGNGLFIYRDQESPQGSSAACSVDLAQQESTLLAAVDTTREWSVDGDDAIVFRGTHELRLRRFPKP